MNTSTKSPFKLSVSVKPRSPAEREYLVKSLPNLHGKHRVPLRVLLSDSFFQSVDCDQGADFQEQLTEIDDDDHASLDHLANTFTSVPTFVGLMRHAASVWVIGQLREIGLRSSAKIRESEPATSPTPTPQDEPSPSDPTSKMDETSTGTSSANDAQILDRLRRVDPSAYQFAQEKDIRLTPRPKWSWAFEWMRSTFDLEERTDSSGTYFAFLYSPKLSDYQILTYLIGVIRRDPAFHKWLEANQIDERGPSSISPAPGTPEFRDYQEQLKEQSYALMAELGATPEEIAARRRGEAANEWLGPGGLFWEIPNAFGLAKQIGRHLKGRKQQERTPAENKVQTRLESNAERQLKQEEKAAGPKSHFHSRHGAQTTPEQQFDRSTTGLTPDGYNGSPVGSSRFLTQRDQLKAVQAAQKIYKRTGEKSFRFDAGYIIGEGFKKGGTEAIQTSNVQAVFNPDGTIKTLYPLLEPLK